MKNKEKRKLHAQAGFSLVELIVVVSILAIMAAGAFSMLGLLNGRQAQQCAKTLSAALAHARTETRSHSLGGYDNAQDADVYLLVKEVDGLLTAEVVIAQETPVERDGQTQTVRTLSTVETYQLSTRELEVSFVLASGIDDSVTAGRIMRTLSAQGQRIAFDRATGALVADSVTADLPPVKLYLKQIVIGQGNRVYTLKITPATGECVEERTR